MFIIFTFHFQQNLMSSEIVIVFKYHFLLPMFISIPTCTQPLLPFFKYYSNKQVTFKHYYFTSPSCILKLSLLLSLKHLHLHFGMRAHHSLTFHPHHRPSIHLTLPPNLLYHKCVLNPYIQHTPPFLPH